LNRPIPRLLLGQSIGGLASSCIDISDGLLADLGHIAKASGVGAKLRLDQMPVPSELADLTEEERWTLQLSGGDDYELCFTATPERWPRVREAARGAGAEAIAIGEIIAGDRCVCLKPDGGEFQPAREGYVHGAPQ
jgi:thiamine-monophosphate kinase